jgi:vacuolar iron transporter family protein
MKSSFMTGVAFGLTSGIITTLGLMVGLNAGTHSKAVVVGGILTIAVADAFSDALGIHMSEESEGKPESDVWESTISTFVSKFLFALTFIIPVLFFELDHAIQVSVVWGLLVLGVFSYIMAKDCKANPWKVIGEHVIIAGVVIFITNYLGVLIASVFN